MQETIFDKIIKNEIKNYRVWEDQNHLAFLTPFATTIGQTVVIPKINHSDYVFNIPDQNYIEFMLATKKVCNILEKAFKTNRVAMIIEGMGVPHMHAKLYPLHGNLNDHSRFIKHQAFYPEYPGYLCSADGPIMSEDKLVEIQKQILDYN